MGRKKLLWAGGVWAAHSPLSTNTKKNGLVSGEFLPLFVNMELLDFQGTDIWAPHVQNLANSLKVKLTKTIQALFDKEKEIDNPEKEGLLYRYLSDLLKYVSDLCHTVLWE